MVQVLTEETRVHNAAVESRLLQDVAIIYTSRKPNKNVSKTLLSVHYPLEDHRVRSLLVIEIVFRVEFRLCNNNVCAADGAVN
jgi:hypothetical protein